LHLIDNISYSPLPSLLVWGTVMLLDPHWLNSTFMFLG
jgi:hypothetical protein